MPRGDYQDVYFVMDDLGRVWREADVEGTDLETVVLDLLEGQYKNPIGIFCFDPAEGWSRNVSEDIVQVAETLRFAASRRAGIYPRIP